MKLHFGSHRSPQHPSPQLDPNGEPKREPKSALSKGSHILIAVLHFALVVALIVFIFRFFGVMESLDVSFVKVIYVPIVVFAMAIFIAMRGIRWLRRGIT